MDRHKILPAVKRSITSAKGHAILTFMIFLLISTIFWFLMTLNDTVQRDYRLEVRIKNQPAGTTFINQPPQYIDVSVKDKGRALVKYDWGTPPAVEIDYADFIKKGENRVVINKEMLSNNIRNSFGSGCEILSIRPDSISLITTTRPGERLPVFLDISVSTMPQYICYGDLKSNIDSVTVYSLRGIPANTVNVRTEPVALRNLKDSTSIKVQLISPEGTRIDPSEITVTIPVEQLVVGKRVIRVRCINTPSGIVLRTFPSNIEIKYLMPMSMYGKDNAEPFATVDYNNIQLEKSTVPVTIENLPDYYSNCEAVPSEVEYVIE